METGFIIVGLIIALVGYVIGMYKRQGAKEEETMSRFPDRKFAPLVIPDILKQLQCTFEEEYDEEEKRYDFYFQYQGGKFHFVCYKESYHCSLMFHNFHEIPNTRQDFVSYLCNSVNIHEYIKLVYAEDEQHDTLALHLMSDVVLSAVDDFNVFVVEDAIHDIFRMQRQVLNWLERYEKDAKNASRTRVRGFTTEPDAAPEDTSEPPLSSETA